MQKTCLVRLENVSKEYVAGSEVTSVLQETTFEGYEGELTLLLGPSGSGKTTFLSLLAGFTRPTTGKVILFGNDLRSYSSRKLAELRALRIGFVFQNFLLIDSLTVEENIELVRAFARHAQARSDHRGTKGINRRSKNDRDQVQQLLERFGIGSLRHRYPMQLSHGEKQRVAIARAIAGDARLILADEPTASLHPAQGLEVIQLLRQLAIDDKRAVIIASHDIRLTSFATRAIEINNGYLTE